MSPFVAVIAIGAVLGNGLDQPSAEATNRIDLRGRWEGWWLAEDGKAYRVRVKVTRFECPDRGICHNWKVVEDANGELHLRTPLMNAAAIYRQDGDHLTICFRDVTKGDRPTSFSGAENHHLLLLDRVKPGK